MDENGLLSEIFETRYFDTTRCSVLKLIMFLIYSKSDSSELSEESDESESSAKMLAKVFAYTGCVIDRYFL